MEDKPGGLQPAQFNEMSFCRWKPKYGGMEITEAKQLRELEPENTLIQRAPVEAGSGKPTT